LVFLQVKGGSVFDNILLCDDPEYAKQVVADWFANNKEVTRKCIVLSVIPTIIAVTLLLHWEFPCDT
jgi:hypothetical protein